MLRNEGNPTGRADQKRQCVFQEETDHIYRCVSLHRSPPPSSFSRYYHEGQRQAREPLLSREAGFVRADTERDRQGGLARPGQAMNFPSEPHPSIQPGDRHQERGATYSTSCNTVPSGAGPRLLPKDLRGILYLCTYMTPAQHRPFQTLLHILLHRNITSSWLPCRPSPEPSWPPLSSLAVATCGCGPRASSTDIQ